MTHILRAIPLVTLMALSMLGYSAFAAGPGVTDTKVVFGQTIGFDSVWGSLYKGYSEGLMAYFRLVNAQGGVHGRQIEVIRLEDNYLTEKAVANIKRFGQDNDVFGLVCIAGTGITEAALPLLEEYKLPTVGALTGAESVRGYNRYLFHTRASYSTEVQKMIQHLDTVGITRVAVLYQDNNFGRNVLAAAQAAVKDKKVQLVAVVPHPVKDWKIADMVKPIAAAQPQAVMMLTAPTTVAEMIKGYRALSGQVIPSPWVLSVTTPAKLTELLEDAVRGIAITQVMPHPSSGVSRLSRKYRADMSQNGNTPNLTYEAMEGYVTGRIVVEALTRAGRNLTRENYIHALEGLGSYSVEDLPVKYSPQSHTGPTFVEPTIIGHQGQVVR
jgi:branched-chain amino acid transport system substrate-binding protein